MLAKRCNKLRERIVERIFSVSGAITTIAIVLIVVFLFREGFGLFGSSTIENGYSLFVNAKNDISSLSPTDTKRIFDGEITDWRDVGGKAGEIKVFRFDEIFNLYSEDAFGDNYALLPDKLAEVIDNNPTIIAFLPDKYAPKPSSVVKRLTDRRITAADFVLGTQWLPTATPSPLYGMLPLILGTLLVSLFAVILALPLGLGVAVYLSELSDNRIRRIMKPAVELLAGIPSVVYGFFGLAVLVPLVQRTFALPVGETAFSAGIVLAIMALPTIISVAEDALRSISPAMREASLALGATKWQTIYRVVIPCAKSGLLAAIVLGIGRAVGETMAVLMVSGNAAVMPHSLFESVRTIPATIAAELGEAPSDGTHYQALFMLGCILFIFTSIVSIAAEIITKKHHTSKEL
ncbi:MAG: phosphate ABC transporter permease subunit PstC [Bacteroidales bacterium]|jgi:phosphate transport system permease protein|nr:phosphate ABC transporter permease subunit PstC [Bacteroidales bacterium]